MRHPIPAGDLRTSLILLLSLTVGLASMHGLVRGLSWLVIAVGFAAAVFAAATLGRMFARSRGAGSVAAVFAGFALLVAGFASNSTLLGVVPTIATGQEFHRLIVHGSQSMGAQTVPATADTGILFILAVLVTLLSVFVDALALWARAPAAAGIPLLALATIPSVIAQERVAPVFFALATASYLLLLRAQSPGSARTPALALAAAIITAALVVPALLPRVPGLHSGPGTFMSTGINPMIDLGRDLRRPAETPALTYRTTAGTGQYLRLTTLEKFEGSEWAPLSISPILGNSVERIGRIPGLAPDVTTDRITTSIRIANITGRWLPVPYAPRAITGLTGTWFWEPNALAVRARDSDLRGQTYVVTSLTAKPTRDQLQNAPRSGESALTRVPELLDPMVAATAREVVAGAETDYDRALALQSWLRTFRYSEAAPVEAGFDGSGVDVIAPFIRARSGYCVHFASTMAIMARVLGIPSRVAVGFLPGEPRDVDGSDQLDYLVTSRDLHSWPELYFSGVGWVRFEPTPGRGAVPYFPPVRVDNPDTPNFDESQLGPQDQAERAQTGGRERDDSGSAPTPAPTLAPNAALASPAVWTALPLALALVLLLPAAVRHSVRMHRFDRIRHGDRSARRAWREIRDTARDLGLPFAATETPRETASQLHEVTALDGAAVEALTSIRIAVEEESFAPADSVAGRTEVDLATLRTVLLALRRSMPVPARLRALLAPASILDWLAIRRSNSLAA